MPVRFEASDDDPWLQGVVIETAAEPLRAVSITSLHEPLTLQPSPVGAG
jgi:hypothetical protein